MFSVRTDLRPQREESLPFTDGQFAAGIGVVRSTNKNSTDIFTRQHKCVRINHAGFCGYIIYIAKKNERSS